MKIPILDLTAETKARRREIDEAIAKILDSGHFIMGENVKAFEAESAAYLGVKHAVTMNSGTDALIIGLRALGVGAGDEVITSPFTFFATAEAISLVGASPVFADIDPVSFNINPYEVGKKITAKTKVILPVHLFGQAADMSALRTLAQSHGVKLFEDAAQAFGADYRGKKLGSLGEAAAFSFFPTKNLGAFGDGGMLTTNDDAVAATARLLRVHGSKQRYHHEALGYASRLDELQAAVLRVKLPWIDEVNRKRQAVANQYDELFEGVSGIETPTRVDYGTHIFHQYTIRIAGGRRDEIQAKLAAQQIDSMIYYPIPIHRLEVYRMDCHLPHAEKAAAEVLSLPIWPDMPHDLQIRVGTALREALK
jgi:dTDP-4-amino-4,6-dideoxygalactose transaminase